MTRRADREPASGWVVAANPSAGSVDDSALGRAVVRLARDGPVRVRHTDGPEGVVSVAHELPDSRLVIFGGDGTISSAVDRLIDAGLGDRPLGVLPGGTGNDFVRAIGLPTEVGAATDLLVDSRPRKLSALRVAERFGINVCHAGLGAAAARTASGLKARLGPFAYPVGAGLSGVRQSAWTARITADGEQLTDGELLMVAMALGRTIGGGTDLTSRSSVTSATADLLVSEGASALARARLGAALLRDDPRQTRAVDHIQATQVRIESEEPIPVNLDGEDLGDQTDVTVKVVEEAWTVLAPR
ncbi:MAG: diacylglycerol/lipid kinase family protein [Iamia sp.]